MNHCPHCNAEISAATGIDTDNGPKEGDFSICIECGEINVFGNYAHILRKPSLDEMLIARADPRLMTAQRIAKLRINKQ